ncbi:myosin heavy chain, clone 203 [Lepisosteus oculatus]|uniref:myosin heavy chain, clone 203 n=1 Tax=Lepisosteus oculatus TaxID=7918 RepID=UPI003716EE7A
MNILIYAFYRVTPTSVMASPNAREKISSRSEALKLVEKYRKERDDALQKESALKERLRVSENKVRTQTESLKQKIKNLSSDNRELRKTVKSLRTDLGLESDPKFRGKTTKDIISDLKDTEELCDRLTEENGKFKLRMDHLASELSNVATSKAILEERVSSLQRDLKDMTNNQRRLLKLWEDKRTEREQLALPAINQRPAQLQVSNKSVQTGPPVHMCQRLATSSWEFRQTQRDTERQKSSESAAGSVKLRTPPIESTFHSPSYADKWRGVHN